MNIVPSYPNLVPLALQPAVEAVGRRLFVGRLEELFHEREVFELDGDVGGGRAKRRQADGLVVDGLPDVGAVEVKFVRGAIDSDGQDIGVGEAQGHAGLRFERGRGDRTDADDGDGYVAELKVGGAAGEGGEKRNEGEE